MIVIKLNESILAKGKDYEYLISKLMGLGYITRSTAWNMVHQADLGNVVSDTFGDNTIVVYKE